VHDFRASHLCLITRWALSEIAPIPERITLSGNWILGLANPLRCGYTLGMKTAISISNDLFDGAERLARRTRKSRSRLFSDALREYLARHAPEKVTECMDQALSEICAGGGEGKDPFVSSASRRTLERSEW
jgi:predicted transcriptional regulator